MPCFANTRREDHIDCTHTCITVCITFGVLSFPGPTRGFSLFGVPFTSVLLLLICPFATHVVMILHVRRMTYLYKKTGSPLSQSQRVPRISAFFCMQIRGVCPIGVRGGRSLNAGHAGSSRDPGQRCVREESSLQ